jgi:transcription elongation factor GreA
MREPAVVRCSRCEALRARRESGVCCVEADETRTQALREELPMVESTLEALQQRVAELEQEVRRQAPEAVSDALEGIANGSFFVASQQLAGLKHVLARAQVVEPDGCALLGSRVILEPDEAQEVVAVELSAPDRADPGAGRISVDSPMGAALLGRRRGETVRFLTPTGVRTVTLTAIT